MSLLSTQDSFTCMGSYMKILSNFDTKFAESLYTQYVQAFGPDQVILVRRSKMFYYWYVARPLLFWIILFSVSLYFVFTKYSTIEWLPIAFWIVTWLYLLLIVRKFMKFLIDYKMDFLIVTPKEVMKYNQTGVFNREVEKIHTDHIKSISVSKKWAIKSFFNVGSIAFLAEWQSEGGDIVMEDIDAVEAVERKVVAILWLNKS